MAELTAFEKIILENDKRKESNLKKKVAADKLQSDKDNKLLVELNDKLADQSKLNEQQIEVLKGQQAEITQRKIDKEEDAKINKDTVKSRLDIRKDNLAQFNKTLTDEGKKAESVQAYRDEDLKIKNEEFELQKKGADNRQARREIEAEQKKMNDDAKKSGSVKEDIKERTNSLAAAFSKSTIGKGILSIGKSIGGFIGGLASTATGGAMMFLKGIISASVLGLIITFLKSDMFKEFLSEENLKKLADFFIGLKGYMKDAFNFIADPENRKSIAYALGIAAFAKMGGLSLIGGTLMALGGLFSLGGIFGKKAITDANASIAKTKKGGGLGKFTKFLKAGALIGLGIAAFDGIKAAQDSYMKGNPFGKIVADSVGEIVKSLTFGIVDAQKISEFLSPSDSIKVAKKEADIRLLEKSIDADGTTTAIKTLKEKKIEQLKSELETFKKDSQKRADLKVKKQDERSAQEEFDIKRKNFIAEGKAADRILGKGLSISERREIGILTSGNFAERKYGKKFDEKFGQQNPQLKLDAKVIKLRNDKRMSDKEEMEKLLADREKKDKLLLGGRTNTFGSTNITNNIVNADQSNNSKSEVKINQGKGVKPSFDFADAFVTSY